MKKRYATISKLTQLVMGGLLLSNAAVAQNPVVKIDFNQSGRQEAETNEPGYTPWIVRSLNADTLTVNGITFIVTKRGTFGNTLGTDWYKAGLSAPYYARLVSDCVTVKDGTANSGGQIELRIKGLPVGNHTLLTYHNTVQSPSGNTFSPIDISLNGTLVVDNLIPTNRVLSTAEAKTAYFQFAAQANTDVVFLFAAETSGTQNVKNVVINALELNTTNALQQAKAPFPKDRDEHVAVAGAANLPLKWSKGRDAVSHNVFFGTDSLAVATATTASPLFKGNLALADTSYAVGNLYSRLNYYWRIDEVTTTGTYPGNTWRFRKAQLAFSDAEGFGKYAIGGRGGKVVEVTNLNDDGPGSLREAVTNDIGPRTIVFSVSGIIALQSRLVLNQPYVYVAGQTAPGKGICIRKAPFGITGNDAIVRHMRVRLGAGTTYDGMGLTGGNYSIMDHCSISWTIDEAFSSRGAKNITLQRTLIAEALNAANHQNYPPGTEHGYAATIGGDTGSYHHNLLTHCYGRNWSLGGGLDGNGFYSGTMELVNNVVYNWGSRTTDGGARDVNFVNNYYKPGPGSTVFYALSMQHENTGRGMQRAYFNGNVMPGRFNESNQTPGRRSVNSNGDTSSYETFVSAPFFTSNITTQTAGDAYKNVLSNAGATQPVFDDHDIRMVNETLDSTYSVTGSVTGKKGFPDSEADAGGYEDYPAMARAANWDSDHDGLPNWWENFKGLNTNSAAGDFSESNADTDMDGYTNLDDYLEWMSNPHYFAPSATTIIIDLKLLARGYRASPAFTVSDVQNATIMVNSAGVATVRPLANGLGSFRFNVTDAQGSTMSRLVNFASNVSIILPVKLQAFDAVRKNAGEVTVTWKTAQEKDNDHFEVERRMAGSNTFERTGNIVKAKAVNGNSSQPLNYEFTDFNGSSKDAYYRLVQVDKDGRATLSETRLVKGIGATGLTVQVWPKPSNGHFSVAVANMPQSSGVLQLIDASGKTVLTRKVTNGTVEAVTINQSGLYILKLIAPDAKATLYTEKVIVN